MPKLTQTQKQKNILRTAFAILFIVSFALVMFERVKIRGQNINAQEDNGLVRAIKGSAISRTLGVQEYKETIRRSLLIINQYEIRLSKGLPISLAVANGVYQELTNINVPEPYQQMHLSLVLIAQEITKQSQADLDLVRNKRVKLYESYPWLSIVAQQ
ncbi:hypothetical protein CL632_03735 [bacterium]|jgi:hypothetical protein|nr:hypothetical protein [bacterium]MDP6756381.1 hypothetical protein [Patescibacteria group bacterium]|tara:strand:- start:5690 stop:6163 length:474 start_codon:yes stop_codon:yes gene_type:complete